MQTNSQPIEQQVICDGTWEPEDLDIVNVWSTIQGEGPFAGCPAVFVRLAGCNFACRYCDTDYTTGRSKTDIVDLVNKIVAYDIPLVVLTGGEPFRQPIREFVWQLKQNGLTVQIETNGSLFQNLVWNEDLFVVCSPKSATIHPQLASHINCFKYVMDAENIDDDGLPSNILGAGCRPARPPKEWVSIHRDSIAFNIYLQPLDVQDETKNAANLAAVLESCRKHNYRVCLQQHKILGLP